jgi:hypothetical protein
MAFPSGLNALQRQMIDQICVSEDAELCKRILAVVTAVYQPVTVDGLSCLVEMLGGAFNSESLIEVVGLYYGVLHIASDFTPSQIKGGGGRSFQLCGAYINCEYEKSWWCLSLKRRRHFEHLSTSKVS